jgi:glycerol-3-phosphate O-acyltransferase
VTALGRELMREVGSLVPVLPVPLVATVFASAQNESLSELELKARIEKLIEIATARGARIYVPRRDWDYAIGAGLEMLTLRHLVMEEDGLYRAVDTELPLLRYYANSIAHLFK